MLVVKKVTKESNGKYVSSFVVGEDQMSFLVTYAINALLSKGLAVLEEDAEPDENYTEILEDIDIEDMGQA